MKKLISLLMALLLCLTLAGCGSKGASSPSYAQGVGATASDNYGGDYEYMETATGSNSSGGLSAPDTDRKLIYHATVYAETKEFDDAKEKLDALIQKYSGFVERSSVSGNTSENKRDRKNLEYTLRIPAGSLFEFLEEVEQAARVLSCDTNMDDVTSSYVDTQARLNALSREEERLLELLSMAENVSEVLEIEDRLSYVRYEIESMTGRLKVYDNEIAYSTVTIYLNDVTDYTVRVSFGSQSYEAFLAGWNNFVSTLQALVIGLLQRWPFLLILAAVIVCIVLGVKRSSKKNRVKFQNAFPAEPPAEPKKEEEKDSPEA